MSVRTFDCCFCLFFRGRNCSNANDKLIDFRLRELKGSKKAIIRSLEDLVTYLFGGANGSGAEVKTIKGVKEY